MFRKSDVTTEIALRNMREVESRVRLLVHVAERSATGIRYAGAK